MVVSDDPETAVHMPSSVVVDPGGNASAV